MVDSLVGPSRSSGPTSSYAATGAKCPGLLPCFRDVLRTILRANLYGSGSKRIVLSTESTVVPLDSLPHDSVAQDDFDYMFSSCDAIILPEGLADDAIDLCSLTNSECES